MRTKDPLFAWPPSSLETDGARLYRPAQNGLVAIGVGAGPGDAWSAVGTGFPGSTMHCRIDSKGNIYALGDRTMKEAFKPPVGQSAWAQLPMGAAMPQDEYGRVTFGAEPAKLYKVEPGSSSGARRIHLHRRTLPEHAASRRFAHRLSSATVWLTSAASERRSR